MGGVPALLLVIAAGITYGWQPDREGGVEYIIQVPPDQVERLEQIGEISSVIDPQVRGQVSRVIIRVGNGPVPKTTPANLTGRSAATRTLGGSELAILDDAPVPIPEMADGNIAEPIPGLESAQRSVLKPDTNSPQGASAYGYPGLPPTLGGTAPAANQGTSGISSPPGSQANSIFGPQPPSSTGAASASSGSIRVPPPATRSPAYNTGQVPPPFTGSDPQGDYARTRAGGPSTDPTNPRDNTWQDFPGVPSSTSAASNGQPMAGTSGAENPFRSSGSTNAASMNGASGYPATGSPSGSNGLAPSDTYGKLPSGFSFSGANGATGTNTAATRSSSAGLASGGAAVADMRLTPGQVAAGAWSIDPLTGQILDRQGQPMRAGILNTGSAAPTNSGNAFNYGSTPSQTSGTPQAGSGFPNYAANGNPTSSAGNRSASMNSSLGQPTAQSSGFDQSNNYGQGTMFGQGTNFGQNSGFGQVSNSRGIDPNQPLTRTIPADYGAVRASAGGETGFNDAAPVRRTSATSSGDATLGRLDPPSLTKQTDTTDSRESEGRRDVVAPQPLFNGLLLISLVANVYLIFWLKNLRLQFRDLVAAKRMAASSST